MTAKSERRDPSYYPLYHVNTRWADEGPVVTGIDWLMCTELTDFYSDSVDRLLQQAVSMGFGLPNRVPLRPSERPTCEILLIKHGLQARVNDNGVVDIFFAEEHPGAKKIMRKLDMPHLPRLLRAGEGVEHVGISEEGDARVWLQSKPWSGMWIPTRLVAVLPPARVPG